MDSVFLAGHRGMVGSAILRALEEQSPKTQIFVTNREELDLTKQKT